jgi:glutathione synthase/RimK-type ligase-like ATP-grasp enzyme
MMGVPNGSVLFRDQADGVVVPLSSLSNVSFLINRDPAIVRQERFLGSIPNSAIGAFSARVGILPGIDLTMRIGVENWERGRACASTSGMCAALAHLIDPRVQNVVHFDMDVLGIDLNLITFGAQYGQRAMGIATNRSDVVVLENETPAANIEAIRRARTRAGLPNAHIISRKDFDTYRTEIEAEFGKPEMFMRKSKLTERLNNKIHGVNAAIFAGVPVPPTHYMGPAARFRAAMVPQFPCILKQEYSAGGSGVHVILDEYHLKNFVGSLAPADPIQVQSFVPGEDISFLFHAGPAGVTLISSSTQEMENGTSHVGNTIPGDLSRIRDEFARKMKPFADLAQRMGYRGHLGIDARIGDDGKIYFIECNPRRTAVSTPTVIATQLGFPQFCHRQMVFKDRQSLDMALARFGYQAGAKEGVMITTYMGDDPNGKHKSEFVFLKQGSPGTELREQVIAWCKKHHLLYEEHH